VGDHRRLFGASFVLYLGFVVGIYALEGGSSSKLDFKILGEAALSAIGPAFLIVLIVDRYLWRFGPVRRALGITVPYIAGRWEGQIMSSFTDHAHSHPVVLEFWQTLSELAVWYYDDNAVTNSLIAAFVRDNQGGPARVYCVYRNQPIRTTSPSLQTHNGVMELIVEPAGRSIVGTYYNNPHQRATYGEISVTLVQRKRLGCFERGPS
jgi:hypothetical protein